tara:strand:+ start:269 stop:370 length:102 start_codon:yes stop_codon:yes gene_type:complete
VLVLVLVLVLGPLVLGQARPLTRWLAMAARVTC